MILVGAGPVAAAMAAPGIAEPGKGRPSGPTMYWCAGASSRSTIRADELIAAVADVVGPGEIEAWVSQARAEYFRLGGSDQSDSPVDEWNCVRDRWRALRQPYPEAYASLRLAEAELAAGDRRAASRGLATAATLAEQLRAAPLAALIADVVHRAGIETVPAPTLDGLTAREREILARVVAGGSNRDIATACSLARRPSRYTCPRCCASLASADAGI